MEMKVALALFGIAYKPYYRGPHTGGAVSIDFARSVQNYKNIIINPFAADVFLSTYSCNKSYELLRAYAPKAHAIDGKAFGRNAHLSRVLMLVYTSEKRYDIIFATRYDLLFQVPFSDVRIDTSTMNIVTRLRDGLICDNVYVFPSSKLRSFQAFVEHTHLQSHYWERNLVRIFGDIHFLTKDPTWVGGIKFYKIVRQRI